MASAILGREARSFYWKAEAIAAFGRLKETKQLLGGKAKEKLNAGPWWLRVP